MQRDDKALDEIRSLDVAVRYEYYLFAKRLSEADAFQAEENMANDVIAKHYTRVWEGHYDKVDV